MWSRCMGVALQKELGKDWKCGRERHKNVVSEAWWKTVVSSEDQSADENTDSEDRAREGSDRNKDSIRNWTRIFMLLYKVMFYI